MRNEFDFPIAKNKTTETTTTPLKNPPIPFSRAYISVAHGKCQLECDWCLNNLNTKLMKPSSKDLSFEHITEIIDFVAEHKEEMNNAAITMAWEGEPMLDKYFWDILEYTQSKGLQTLVFTSGIHIPDKETAKKLLEAWGVLVKKNSMNLEAQNKLVKPNEKWTKTAEKMQAWLDYLIEARKELHQEEKEFGMLWIESYISKKI